MSAASFATEAAPSSLHPNLRLLNSLLGVWTGSGTGTYPTIKPFQYTETITFTSPNPTKPLLTYSQSTQIGGQPAHSETGYWKLLTGGGRVECVVAQVTGLAEVEEGTVVVADEENGVGSSSGDGVVVVDVRTSGLSRTSSAKPPHVRQIRRVWMLSEAGGQLEYEVLMATDNTPELTSHLKAQFTRKE